MKKHKNSQIAFYPLSHFLMWKNYINKRDRERDEYSTPGGINKETGIPLAYDEEDTDDDISDTISDTKEEVKTKWPSQMILFGLFAKKLPNDAARKIIRSQLAIEDLRKQWVISDEWVAEMTRQMYANTDPYADTTLSRTNKSGVVVSVEIKWQDR